MRTILTIEGADNTGANYLTWAPVQASIRLVEVGAAAGPVAVVLRNANTAQGGQVEFSNTLTGARRNRLQLNLPVNGNPVNFFVAGKFNRPSTANKDAAIQAVQASNGSVLSTNSVMVRIRKNANRLTTAERDRFLAAFATLNNRGMGKFSDFRNVHTQIGTREAHFNFGFLPWHRAYLLDLERELQLIDPSVALPYWKFDETARNVFTRGFMGVSVGGRVTFDPGNPLQFWVTDLTPGILRSPRFNTMTSSAFVISEAQTLNLGSLYALFRSMEGSPHGDAHTSFGGYISDIDTAAKDPLFFMLHANVDRMWAKWQRNNRRFDSTNTSTYTAQGSAGTPGSVRAGHNLNDTMWPWNGITGGGRPPTAPGGPFPPSPVANAPGPTPTVRSMIDYQGVLNRADRLGFAYDDVSFQP
jgi:tyrosinase